MGKKIIALSLALVMALSFAACGGEETALPSAQEIVDGVIQAQGNVRTYEFDMDMSMDMGGEAEGESIEMTIAMDGSGACDVENQQMKMDMTMTMNIPMLGMDEIETQAEMYLIENMMYMMMDIPDTGPTWTKEEMPEGSWEEESLARSQAELLEAAEVEVIGSETVQGVDCYVLELTPNLEQLWEIMMEESALGFGEDMGLSGIDEELLEEMLQNFSVKQWIAKDTYYLTKAEISMAMELTSEFLGSPEEEGEMTMDIAMTMLMYNYNQPVSIELPPEAEESINATEANQEVATVETAAMAYYSEYGEWPVDSTILVDNEYLSEAPLYAVYTFDEYGIVDTVTPTQKAIDAGLTWNATDHRWE